MQMERWEACGNVYLLVERAALRGPLTAEGARLLCDPATGPGSDGVIELLPGVGPIDVAMIIWNPDGTTTEACGNGTRMVARWASERHGSSEVVIGSEAGPLHCSIDGEMVRAALSPARLDGPQYRPTAESFPYPHRFVSVGNPHVVIPVEDVDAFPLDEVGPQLEHHPWFPERTNVEITAVVDEHRVRMRVWERGVGETPACGTGATAAAVAAAADGLVSSPITVETPGGELTVEIGAHGAVTLGGPARRVEVIDIDPELGERLTA